MSDKRRKIEYSHRRELQNADIRVEQRDVIEPNHGLETWEHQVAKLAAAYIVSERGYRYDSEVEVPQGEIDVLAYASTDRDCFAIECETNPTDDVIRDKRRRYVEGLPIRDVFVIDVGNLPETHAETLDYVEGCIF